MRLKDKVSLITGAASGIGKATALTFAQEGADVIVNDLKEDRVKEVANEIIKIGRRAIAFRADVANRDEVFKMVSEVMKEFGKIDILVNNAGIVGWPTDSLLNTSKEEVDTVFGVNFFGSYYCIQAVAPYMIKQRYGKIINLASVAGIGESPPFYTISIAYPTSKAAIIMLTKNVAYELGKYNINVNAIAPGVIRTEIFRRKINLQKATDKVSLGRIGEPQDIANVALFLGSDESSFITGQVIVADGGKFNLLTHSV